MSSKFHFVLLAISFLVFAIFTPIILLYADGYRFDLKERTFVKTGSLFISSYPRGATVVINGKPQKTTRWLDPFSFFWRLFGLAKYGGETPTIINDLLPGKYKIEVVKKGFQKWRKNATIEPNLITRFEKIQLFFKKPQLKIIDRGEISFFWPSESRKILIYGIRKNKTTETVKLFQDHKINILIDDPSLSNFSDPIWGPGEKKIIFSCKAKSSKAKKYFLLDLTNKQLINLNAVLPFLKRGGAVFKFNKNNPNYLLVGIDGRLVRVDISSFQRKIIFRTTGQLEDWLFNKNYLEIIRQEKNGSVLEKFSFPTPQKLIFSLPLGPTNFSFLDNLSLQGLEFLSDGGNLLFITKNPLSLNEKPIIFKFRGRNIVPFPEKNKLLYFNDHEIQILQINEGSGLIFPWQKNIITRQSGKINNIFLFNNWIYYLSQNKISALEIDFKDFKNQHLLFPTSGEQAKALNNLFAPSEDLVYFTGIINNQAGLYSIKIK